MHKNVNQKFKPIIMDKLMEVLSIQSESYNQWRMFAYIIRQLKEIPDVKYYVVDGNIYAQRGEDDDYPCMVSHMDTVHDIVEDLYPVDLDGYITGFNRVTMEQVGIGGDDKVGVFITLEMLRKFDNMKVAFFRDEEVGCRGSYVADMGFFSNCRFILQCDRRGNDDFIIDASGIELSSSKFQDDVFPIISNYGYKFAHGMMTDVMALKENGVRCSVANIGCGYYNPHTAQEYVSVYDVEVCMEMCETIIKYCVGNYKHKYKKSSSKKGYTKAVSHWGWAEPYETYPSAIDSRVSIEEQQLCRDCYGDYATKDGLCKSCLSWYERDMELDTRKMNLFDNHNDIF